jgi:A/G-specific adenine glycosylase
MIALDGDASAAHALLTWYRANRRALPWRESRDPYRVLVSEIMLQQTRVETVLSYYERFISAFPDVETLAAARIEEVLAKWSGLGYYFRARRLHAAARAIVDRGDFPRTEAELLELPGVGAYTAAAIASIAFGAPVAVVDGNVERVIARLLALDVDPAQGRARRLVRETAARLLVRETAGDSNQALMELGAVICLPRRPRCLICPLLDGCAARSSGRTEELPVRAPRRPGVAQRRVVAVARRGERFLLVRNPDRSELLAGVWEFPWTERALEREEWEAGLARSYGGEWSVGSVRGSARHAITFRSLELEIRDAEVRFDSEAVADGENRPEPGWFSLEQIEAVPTTSMVRKVLACLAPSAAPKTT